MADLDDLLPKLREHQAIIVTGPQRSGTTIGAHIISAELGYQYIDESQILVEDLEKARMFLAGSGVVLQAPGLCHAAHEFGCPVVIMRRACEAIRASQQRINWIYESHELEKYGLSESPEGIAEVKYRTWDTRQKSQCLSFNLDYESLANHPLWVEQKGRKTFGVRQWQTES